MAAQSSGNRKETGFDTPSVVLLTLAGLFLIYALSLFLQGGYLSARKADHARKLDLPGDPALLSRQAAQQDLLNGEPVWLDREAGTVGLPIEVAKERLVQELASQEAGAAHE